MSLSEKMADKALNMAAVKKKWRAYMKEFGPLLKDMFAEDGPSRIRLIQALDHLSQRKFEQAREELTALEKFSKTTEDICGIHFFLGFVWQLRQKRTEAIDEYTQCVELQPDFYLPYLRLGILLYLNQEFDDAEENFCAALTCFERADQGENAAAGQIKCLLNHSRSLITIHRYREAIAEMDKAKQIRGSDSDLFRQSRIMAYAALGEEEACKAELASLDEESDMIRMMAEKILSGKDTHYAVSGIDEAYIPAFWDWFCQQEQFLDAAREIGEKLKPLFPEIRFEPLVSVYENHVTVQDLYNATLMEGYRLLLEAAPAKLMEEWSFTQIR